MSHAKLAVGWVSALLVAGVVACGSDMESMYSRTAGDSPDGGLSAGEKSPSAGNDSELGPTDNGVIIVHAAGTSAFRLCFENEFEAQPTPSNELMPNANVVGVDVGSAVRVGPLKGAPGDVYLFSEDQIRSSYPPGAEGPSCARLFSGTAAKFGVKIGRVDTSLATGIHLLVVGGCGAKNPVYAYSKEKCGDDWDPESLNGNLNVTALEVRGQSRTSDTQLPAQVLHLSRALESDRGSALRVTFGDLAEPQHASSVIPVLNQTADFTTPPSLQANDTAQYGKLGFRVVVDRNGTSETLVEQSLVEIQRLSSPRTIPATYYSLATNYVFLMLGDPSVKADAGVDERRGLHLLALPVVTRSTADAGADADAVAP